MLPRWILEANVWTGLVLSLAFAFFGVNAVNVARRGPYPMHADEAYVTEHAWGMVVRGDLNPGFYKYGSLPIYLSAASLGAAAALARARGEIDSFDDVGPVAYPYYSHPSISLAPRYLFSLFASIVLCAVAVIGFHLRARWETLFVPMLALVAHPLFQDHAWSYVNVDILATMLATSGLAYLLTLRDTDTFRMRVAVPALIVGAAIATKYNAGLLLLPFAVHLARRPRGRAVLELCCLALGALLAFLLFQPYAVLDWSHFTADLLAEMNHYRTGHFRHENEPGLAQLSFHLLTFYEGFGPVFSTLLLLGVVYGFATERKKTLLLLLYPVTALAFMSMQRVNFPRNLLPAQVCLSVFTGMGLLALEAVVRRMWGRIRPGSSALLDACGGREWLLRSVSPALALALLWGAPSTRPGGALSFADSDSRQQVADWLIETAPHGACRLLAPVELGLSPNTITHHCGMWTFEVSGDDATPEGLAETIAPLLQRRHTYIALPRWKEGAERWNALPPLLALERPVLKVGLLKMRLDKKRTTGNPRIDVFTLE